MIIPFIILLILVVTLITIREKFDVTPGSKIKIKYIAEDAGGLPNGLGLVVGGNSIHEGTVSSDGNTIKWDKMTAYFSEGNAVSVPSTGSSDVDIAYNKKWFGTGNVAPTNFVRFPTVDQLKTSTRPSRKWPNGWIEGDKGANEDGCLNGQAITTNEFNWSNMSWQWRC